MGLFNKKKTAEDILKMIAELPDEERALVKEMIDGTSQEEAEESAETEAEKTAEESTEVAPSAESEAEEDPALDSPAEEEANEEPEEAEPEEAGETVAESEPAEEAPTETVESEPEGSAPEISFAEILDRVNRMDETLRALAQRLDAADAEKKEEDDPFGMSIGAEARSDDQEDDLERAKREAGFNF